MDCSEYRARHKTYSDLPLPPEIWNTPEYEAWMEHFHDCRACSDWDLTQRVRARGHDPGRFPCVHIADQVTRTCEEHPDPEDCNDILITHSAPFDEYGITKLGSHYVIEYCPWCGVKLPESRRDQFCEEVEKLGLDPFADDLPEKYRSDAWYRDS